MIDKRNTDVAVNKNLLIEMDPEVAEIYAASTAVSSKLKFILNTYLSELTYFANIASKGIDANMLKVGTKRRRISKQVKAEREEEAIKEIAL